MNDDPGRACVTLMLIRDHQVLAEKRRLTKALAPGTVAIPGGHVEHGESLGHALVREAREELGILPRDVAYVCTLKTAVNEYLRLEREGGLVWRTRA